MRHRWILATSCVSALLAGGQALAQDTGGTVEEIVVTAQKRAENLQDVPVAITALTASTLKDLGVTNVQDLTGVTPGLQIKNADASANPKIFIRGVGLNDFNPNAASAVGVYVDGVYVGSPLAQMGAFFDLERVEVLRGPQGTLYGRNTTGGAINVITKRPSFDWQGEGAAELGRFDSVNVSAAVGGPLVADKLAFRLAGQVIGDEGTTTNRLTGNRVNDADRWAGRLSLLFTPSEDIEILAQLRGGENKGSARQVQHRGLVPNSAEATGADGLCKPAFFGTAQCTDVLGYADTDGNAYAGDYNLEGRDEVRLFGASVQGTWDLGPATLVSITAFDRARRNDLEDTDGSPNQMLEISYIARQRQFTQELRLQSNGEDALKWVVGAYYAHDDLKTSSALDVLRALRPLFVTPDNPSGFDIDNSVVLAGYPYSQKTDSYAVFGQVDYALTDRVTLQAGLRWSEDQKDFSYASTIEGGFELFAVEASKSFSSVSGRLGLQYRLTDDAQFYASYNRGYKSGGFFGGYSSDPADLEPVADETVDAYEMGLKSELFDRRVRFNASAFYYDYKDLQVYTLVERNGITVQELDNASNARVYGGEAEITTSPLEGLDISAGVALLNATYRDYQSFGEDLSGNRLPSAPKFSFNGLVHYERDLPSGGMIETTLDASYRSKVYFETRNLERLSEDGMWLVNGRVGWKTSDGKLGLGLWGRNLFDETYVVDVSNLESFGFDALSMGSPRTYGVYFRYSY